jgi:hypothetical protein
LSARFLLISKLSCTLNIINKDYILIPIYNGLLKQKLILIYGIFGKTITESSTVTIFIMKQKEKPTEKKGLLFFFKSDL